MAHDGSAMQYSAIISVQLCMVSLATIHDIMPLIKKKKNK